MPIPPVFPSTGSIPPACFYTPQGLAGFLNQNPTYKQYFAATRAFEYLYPLSVSPCTFSSIGYNPTNVPLCSNVQTLSQYQSLQYRQQLNLFQKVYAFNSNAYVNYATNGVSPMYYNYITYTERNSMKSAIALVNKLYPFDAMSRASTLNWQVPFPLP
jgi:hypothetical protein